MWRHETNPGEPRPVVLRAELLTHLWLAAQGADSAQGGAKSLALRSVSDLLRSYLTVAIFGTAAVLMAFTMFGVARILRPQRPTPQKLIAYESGVDPVGSDWTQSQIRYYVFAVLFVLFDVEAVFIFPWATRLDVYALFGLVEMAIFIFILVLGLFYAWRKGVLRWV